MPRSRTGHEMRWVLIAVLVMLLVALFGRMRVSPYSHPLEGADAPDIQLPRLGGGSFALSQEHAPVIVLDFWASWCGPCLSSLPRLEEVHQWANQQNKPVAIYCVNQGEEPNVISELWQRKRLTMPVLLDRMGIASSAYQAMAIPQTVVISNRKIVQVYLGVIQVDALQRVIEKTLAAR